ncbi:hypothetical protein EJ06DRAFT_551354 [Trichodelitschia bisporula]|uniref:BZIP domain-containing protein n=1 Tax=Trichodelitschia bisporula TaxID=703511 RepID=A0A6G1HLP1_9PEZI|nr:hypothetical protein EJ06DRAFT_551354 [Trichodelitschia bisporula]
MPDSPPEPVSSDFLESNGLFEDGEDDQEFHDALPESFFTQSSPSADNANFALNSIVNSMEQSEMDIGPTPDDIFGPDDSLPPHSGWNSSGHLHMATNGLPPFPRSTAAPPPQVLSLAGYNITAVTGNINPRSLNSSDFLRPSPPSQATNDEKPTRGQAKTATKTKRTKRKASINDDEEKRNTFLQRNREAATRCRIKKRERHQQIEEKSRMQEQERMMLKAMAAQLRSEVLELKGHCLQHVNCQCEAIREYMRGQVPKMVPSGMGSSGMPFVGRAVLDYNNGGYTPQMGQPQLNTQPNDHRMPTQPPPPSPNTPQVPTYQLRNQQQQTPATPMATYPASNRNPAQPNTRQSSDLIHTSYPLYSNVVNMPHLQGYATTTSSAPAANMYPLAPPIPSPQPVLATTGYVAAGPWHRTAPPARPVYASPSPMYGTTSPVHPSATMYTAASPVYAAASPARPSASVFPATSPMYGTSSSPMPPYATLFTSAPPTTLCSTAPPLQPSPAFAPPARSSATPERPHPAPKLGRPPLTAEERAAKSRRLNNGGKSAAGADRSAQSSSSGDKAEEKSSPAQQPVRGTRKHKNRMNLTVETGVGDAVKKNTQQGQSHGQQQPQPSPIQQPFFSPTPSPPGFNLFAPMTYTQTPSPPDSVLSQASHSSQGQTSHSSATTHTAVSQHSGQVPSSPTQFTFSPPGGLAQWPMDGRSARFGLHRGEEMVFPGGETYRMTHEPPTPRMAQVRTPSMAQAQMAQPQMAQNRTYTQQTQAPVQVNAQVSPRQLRGHQGAGMTFSSA